MGLANMTSPRGTSIAIGVESPSSKTRTRSQAPSEKLGSEHHSQAAPTVSDSPFLERF